MDSPLIGAKHNNLFTFFNCVSIDPELGIDTVTLKSLALASLKLQYSAALNSSSDSLQPSFLLKPGATVVPVMTRAPPDTASGNRTKDRMAEGHMALLWIATSVPDERPIQNEGGHCGMWALWNVGATSKVHHLRKAIAFWCTLNSSVDGKTFTLHGCKMQQSLLNFFPKWWSLVGNAWHNVIITDLLVCTPLQCHITSLLK